MNPETLYPELKEMKASEIFIEWAYIVRDFKLDQKIHVRRVIPRTEQNAFVKALKLIYGVSKPDELDKEGYLEKFERVELVTIER
jgi:hypothetical protein